MHTLQGYRMDDKDTHGLRISYARSNLGRGGRDREDRGERRRDDREKKELAS
jgi:hypothetical protein